MAQILHASEAESQTQVVNGCQKLLVDVFLRAASYDF